MCRSAFTVSIKLWRNWQAAINSSPIARPDGWGKRGEPPHPGGVFSGGTNWKFNGASLRFLRKPGRELKPTARERVILFGGNYCALVIENAPALGSSLPNGGATGEALNLAQRVSKKIGVRAKATESVIVALPAGSNCIDGRILLQSRQDELTAVAAPRCACLPIFGRRGFFKVGARRTEV